METELKNSPAKSDAEKLPIGWEWKIFGNLLSKSQYGLTTNASENGQYPMFRMNNFVDGRMVANDMVYVDLDEKELKAYLLKPGDILFNRTNSYELVGKTGLFNLSGEFIFASYLVRLRADLKKASPEYLNYFLNWRRTQRQLKKIATVGVSQCNINPTALGKFLQVPLPPLSQQRRIAAILSTWDEAIQTADQLVKAKQECKSGLMQQLLTSQKRLPGFSGEWREVKLGEVFSERNETKRSHLPLLAITASKGVVMRNTLEKRDTSNEDKGKYLRICPGDIGYNTMRMWQGVSGVSEYEGLISPAYTVLIPSKSIDVNYMAYLFKYQPMIHLFWRYSQGLVDDTLNCKYDSFRRVHVAIPTVEEQRAITKVLNAVDEEIVTV